MPQIVSTFGALLVYRVGLAALEGLLATAAFPPLAFSMQAFLALLVLQVGVAAVALPHGLAPAELAAAVATQAVLANMALLAQVVVVAEEETRAVQRLVALVVMAALGGYSFMQQRRADDYS